MKPTAEFSRGARYERQAVRTYLRRMKKDFGNDSILDVIIEWMAKRCERYDKAEGGLGKK